MDKLFLAKKILKEGGIVVFPTDTAYGIGCRMDDKIAVKRLFAIRKRPKAQAAPVLVDSIGMAEKYLLSPLQDNVRLLMEKYWPGGLTIIYPCRMEKVPQLVRGGGRNLGVRMPDHKIALALIKEAGVPILGPSANFHGSSTPYTFAELDKELLRRVDFTVEGDCIPIVTQSRLNRDERTNGYTVRNLTAHRYKFRKASTVIDCSVSPWKIIREGAVKMKKIILYLDTADNKKTIVRLEAEGKKIELIRETASWVSQNLLPMINEILSEQNLSPADLYGIKINTGPGSFTGLKVGAAVANILGWYLDIPINGRKGRIFPVYQ